MLRNKLFVVLYIDNRSFVVVQSDFSILAQPQLVLQQSPGSAYRVATIEKLQ